MSVRAPIPTDRLIEDLRRLCASPSGAGQNDELAVASSGVADLMRRSGLDVCVAQTEGAPVLLGRLPGRSPFTVLLYHHYDVAPTGPWRAWYHEPFQLAEREGQFYARGVAHGKGPLVAHLQAIRTTLETTGELPCGVAMLVEGEGLIGSPHLESVITRHTDLLRADACLGSVGERDVHKRPFCHTGSKGLLQIILRTTGTADPLLPGLSSVVRNPAWRLVWALGHLKGEDEDIRVNGFYDMVEGPNREENALLRRSRLDEEGRLFDWQLPEFLFGLSGVALVRAEVTLPTCNLASFTVEPSSGLPGIATAASAQLDFQLVPTQHPDTIFNLVREQLIARSFLDVMLERVPGGYPAARTPPGTPFLQQIVAAGKPIYGEPLAMLPFGPFTLPLHFLARHLGVPVATVGVARNDSALRGPNEHVPLTDLVRHGQFLIELLHTCAGS